MRVVLWLAIFFCTSVWLHAETSVEIDLQEQRAYLLQNGRPVLASPISSGRYGHLTKTGSFTVLQKERDHYSSMYGKIVDANGNTVVAETGCTPDIYRVMQLRTVASACRSNTPSRFSVPCRSELLSRCSAERP